MFVQFMPRILICCNFLKYRQPKTYPLVLRSIQGFIDIQYGGFYIREWAMGCGLDLGPQGAVSWGCIKAPMFVINMGTTSHLRRVHGNSPPPLLSR